MEQEFIKSCKTGNLEEIQKIFNYGRVLIRLITILIYTIFIFNYTFIYLKI